MTPRAPALRPSPPSWQPFEAVVEGRRSVHVFDPAPVSEEDMRAILGAAVLAPSSFNMQPYQLIWVHSTETRQELARLCLAQRPAVTAAELIVCVARWDTWRETGAEHEAFLASRADASDDARRHQTMVRDKAPFFFAEGPLNLFGLLRTLLIRLRGLRRPQLTPPGSADEHRTWAVKSASLACAHLMLAARARGLDTCAMEGFDHRRVVKLLGIEGRFFIPMIIAVGYRGAEDVPEPRFRRSLDKLVRKV